MKLWPGAQALRNLFRKQQVEKQLDEELRSYVNMVADERVSAGMSAAEARRTTLAEFGGVEQVKQAVRDRRSGAGMERLWRDVRYGLRQLARNPGFTATVILTLALSIGANTAVFSIVNALMLKSLPYPHPERMGTIYTRTDIPAGGSTSSDERHHVNGEQWELLRDQVPALISAISNIRATGVDLQAGSQVVYLHYGRVSAHYLDVLGIRPFLGRNFSDAEDLPHGARTAILSYALWSSTFGSNPGILGQTILLKSEPYTVIGVLPQGAAIPLDADLYTPIQASQVGEGGGTNFQDITRLRDGATWPEVDAEINRAWLKRRTRYELSGNPGAQVSYHSVPLQKGETAKVRPQALALMLAAGLILLIACANLAGLTLVRMLRRTPEMATRMALGASRWQLQRQLWVENLLLALMGGAAGILVGFGALRGLLALLPRALSAIGFGEPGQPRAGVHPRRFPNDQRALWHAAGAGDAGVCPAHRHGKPERRRRRTHRVAPGADRKRGCADRGAAGCLRPADPHADSPGNFAGGVRSHRRDDGADAAGRCALSRRRGVPEAAERKHGRDAPDSRRAICRRGSEPAL